jgi:hypothetical protein
VSAEWPEHSSVNSLGCRRVVVKWSSMSASTRAFFLGFRCLSSLFSLSKLVLASSSISDEESCLRHCINDPAPSLLLLQLEATSDVVGHFCELLDLLELVIDCGCGQAQVRLFEEVSHRVLYQGSKLRYSGVSS